MKFDPKFTKFELISHKIKKFFIPFLVNKNCAKLNNTDFTIISNNCWAGICYEYFGLPKNSPTVGTFIYASDYIKLISNLRYYMSLKIKMISPQESSHYEELKRANHQDTPIGKLDDVEIVFLHYNDKEIAQEKWNRRVERINWNNLIFKFSYMCNCTDQQIEDFSRISGIKKFCFVPKNFDDMTDLILHPSRINSLSDLGDDTFEFNKYIDVIELINMPQTGIDSFELK